MAAYEHLNSQQFSRFSPGKAYELSLEGIDPDNPRLMNRQEFHAAYAPGHYDAVPIDHVLAIQNQVGTGYSQDLADSIQAHGIQEPIRVGYEDGYQGVGAAVDDGHHRIAAARALGLSHVPVDVDNHRRV